MTTQPTGKFLAIGVLIIIIALAGYYVLNAPDQRNPAQKMSDAVNELPNGVDKAARQLENRTPADKLEDAASDANENLKKATNQPRN